VINTAKAKLVNITQSSAIAFLVHHLCLKPS